MLYTVKQISQYSHGYYLRIVELCEIKATARILKSFFVFSLF